uniref:Uncharacterized protein n=1 Tax=Arundo donax TaxID=35708 RepID=A0A0A9ASR7_ARUDO
MSVSGGKFSSVLEVLFRILHLWIQKKLLTHLSKEMKQTLLYAP